MRTKKTVLPGIPVAGMEPESLHHTVTALTETVEVLINRRGDPADRAITLRDLIDAGMVQELLGGIPQNAVFNPGTFTISDPLFVLTTPTKPTNVRVHASFHLAFVTWDSAPYGGHSHTEVWRSNDNILANASLIATVGRGGASYTDEVTSGQSYWYFLRHVSRANPPVYSPWSDTAGHEVTINLDPAYVADVIDGLVVGSGISAALEERIDLIDGAATLGAGVATQLISEGGLLSKKDQLFMHLYGTTTAIETSDSITAAADGSGATLAQKTVKIDNDGYVVGYGLMNDGVTSAFVVRVDTFAIASPSVLAGAPAFPFTIGLVDGLTRISMNAATYIQDATITRAAMQLAIIDEALIEDGAVTNLKIGDIIQSSGWNDATKQGWEIDKAGNIQASSIVIYDENGQTLMNAGGLAGNIPYDSLTAQRLMNAQQEWSEVNSRPDMRLFNNLIDVTGWIPGAAEPWPLLGLDADNAIIQQLGPRNTYVPTWQMSGVAALPNEFAAGLYVDSNAAFGLGVEEFSIDFWVYADEFPPISEGDSYIGLVDMRTAYSTGMAILIDPLGYIVVMINGEENFLEQITLSTWHRVSVHMHPDLALIGMVDGVGAIDFEYGARMDFGASNPCRIGGGIDIDNFVGFIESLRITKGLSRAYYYKDLLPVSPMETRAGTAPTINSRLFEPYDAGFNQSSDAFGYSLAVSTDGLVMVVGNPQFSGAGLDENGAVFTYDLVADVWTQRGTRLEAAISDTRFGQSVALSADGDIMAVGANYESTTAGNSGAVSIWDRSGLTWVQRGSDIKAATPTADWQFGCSVSLSSDGSVLVVGSSGKGTLLGYEGEVYFFDWVDPNWVVRASTLAAPVSTQYEAFGTDVDLSDDGTVLIVSSNAEATDYDTDWSYGAGAVYVYDLVGAAWVLRGSALTAPNGDVWSKFGESVSISQDNLVLAVGAPDYSDDEFWFGFWVFDWDGVNWISRQTDQPYHYAGDSYDYEGTRMGWAIALTNNGARIVAGCPSSDHWDYYPDRMYGEVITYDTDLFRLVEGVTTRVIESGDQFWPNVSFALDNFTGSDATGNTTVVPSGVYPSLLNPHLETSNLDFTGERTGEAGWESITTAVVIDNTLTYRLLVAVKKTTVGFAHLRVDADAGLLKHMTDGIVDFHPSVLFEFDSDEMLVGNWYLAAIYIYPATSTAPAVTKSAIYDAVTGIPIDMDNLPFFSRTRAADWRWDDATAIFNFSVHQISSDQTLWVVPPILQLVDGTELSVRDWLADTSVVTGNNPVGPSNIATFIRELAVDTLYIAGNAVTVPMRSYTEALSPMNTAIAPQTMASLTFPATGDADVYISMSMQTLHNIGTDGGYEYHLYIDGVLVNEMTFAGFATGDEGWSDSSFYVFVPGSAGSYLIEIIGYTEPVGDCQFQAFNRALTCIEYKR